jgi:hypothetical protein
MTNAVELRIVDIAGTTSCVASEDGEKVHHAIVEALRRGEVVRLSFAGVEDLTSAFLNAAVGQLYNGEFTEQYIRAHIAPPKDASQDDLFLLKRVVERAKDFFRNPDGYKEAVKAAMEQGHE